MTHWEIRAPLPEDDADLESALSRSLHLTSSAMPDWYERIGRENFRAVIERGRVVAGLVHCPMGQWFGGQRVPLVGINGVGVAPDRRGSGVGSAMLAATLAELRAAGTPLSALYPATLPYYERAGYERAGYRLTYELPIEAIDTREYHLDLDPITTGTYDEVYQAYTRQARRNTGNLDRPAWMWHQRLEPENQQPYRFLVRNAGQVEGYVVYTQGARADPLKLIDVCVLTPAAGRRILTLFAGYRSMIEKISWNGGPLDPLLYLLGENLSAGQQARATILRPLEWMLRIVDVELALAARGYPAGITAELHLDVRDDTLTENSGRYILTIADGRAQVATGGQGRIALGIRELAALYSGFRAPAEVCTVGALAGPAEDLAVLGAVFAGPRPWCPDIF